MNMYEVYLKLSTLYANSLLSNGPFFEKVAGDFRISVTHKQATILSITSKRCVMMLLDVSGYANNVKNKIMFSDRHGKTSTAIEIGNLITNDFDFISDLPMMLPQGKQPVYPVWNLNEITEEFIFQQSTIDNLPEYKYFDQLKRYHKDINSINGIAKTSTVIHLDFDWDNIPLTEEDFV